MWVGKWEFLLSHFPGKCEVLCRIGPWTCEPPFRNTGPWLFLNWLETFPTFRHSPARQGQRKTPARTRSKIIPTPGIVPLGIIPNSGIGYYTLLHQLGNDFTPLLSPPGGEGTTWYILPHIVILRFLLSNGGKKSLLSFYFIIGLHFLSTLFRPEKSFCLL